MKLKRSASPSLLATVVTSVTSLMGQNVVTRLNQPRVTISGKPYNEVKELGDVNSTERPQDRTNVALFYEDEAPVRSGQASETSKGWRAWLSEGQSLCHQGNYSAAAHAFREALAVAARSAIDDRQLVVVHDALAGVYAEKWGSLPKQRASIVLRWR